jgi:hypothetical protein
VVKRFITLGPDLLLALVASVRLGEGWAAEKVLDANQAVPVLAFAHRP